jgi:hypothetical protein
MIMGVEGTGSAARDDRPVTATDGDSDESAERATRVQAGTNDTRSQPRAETLTREEYADLMRGDGGPMSRANRPHNGETPEREPPYREETRAGHTADHDRAESRDRETYASDIRAGQHRGRAATPADLPAATTLDPPPASGGSRADQPGAGRLPETITYEGKEVEITHNAADGLWVEGLPGGPPARIGDLVSSADDPARGRGEKLRNEFNKEAEDITEQGGKWADFVQEILDNPRPTHSMTQSRSPEVAMAAPEHGINAGQGAEALLTLAIVGAAAVHKLHERWQRHGSMVGRREAHDAGN